MANRIITIGRQFGSGGRELGEKVAKSLGIPFYDRALIELASKRLQIDTYDLEQVDEKAENPIIRSLKIPNDEPDDAIGYALPVNEQIQQAQADIIQEAAQRGDCVIIGRCADYILRDNLRCISVFISADKGDRIRRIRDRYQLSEKEAAAAIRRVDKKRRLFYETYTDWEWGSMYTHQAILNVSHLGMERAATILKDMYRDI